MSVLECPKCGDFCGLRKIHCPGCGCLLVILNKKGEAK